MKIHELNEKYTNGELTSTVGDQALHFQLLSPLFRNLYENKVIYHERFTCIIKLEDIELSPERFSAIAIPHLVIRSFHNFHLPDKWTIGANWAYLKLSRDLLAAYSSWLMWPDPALVEKVEKLVLNHKFDEAESLTIGKHRI